MKIIIMILAFILAAPCVVSAGNLTMGETPYSAYNMDKWGTLAVPSPNGYLPVKSVGGFTDPQDLFYDAARREVWLADAGGVSVYGEDGAFLRNVEFTLNGSDYELGFPTGVFVTKAGELYVCDRDGGVVVRADRDGVITDVYGVPESELISSANAGNYRPSKIVVDGYGKMYVQAAGVFEGVYGLDADGSFINFYGANKVEMTLARLAQQAWKRLLTKEQRRAMQSFVPIEYSNLFIDGQNFIYATVATTADAASGSADIFRGNSKELVRKLNPLGVNVLNKTNMNWFQTAAFTDITVDEAGVMTFVDAMLGLIYQCDKNGRLMFAFGGVGSQAGLLRRPTAIAGVGDDLWVLDAGKRSITIFKPTEFGAAVHKAMTLYNDGLYNEAVGPWEEVLKMDANYVLAYEGLGKAYFQLEDYERSMYYFKLAGDRAGYSDAFSERGLIVMRANFGWLAAGILALVITPAVVKRVRRRRG